MINIVDRSGEHVAEIKNTKVVGPGANLAQSIESEDELSTMVIEHENSPHPTCTVTDGTLREPMFRKIAAIKGLRELTLKRCEFKGADLKLLIGVPLEAIHIDEGNIDAEYLDAIAKMRSIRFIELYACDVHPNAFKPLGRSGARWLQLRSCQSTAKNPAFTAEDLAGLGEMKNLDFLELERSNIASGALSKLSKSGLIALNLRQCNLTDTDILDIVKIPKLIYVSLERDPRVSCQALKFLLNDKRIQYVSTNGERSMCTFNAIETKKMDRDQFQVPVGLYRKFSRN